MRQRMFALLLPLLVFIPAIALAQGDTGRTEPPMFPPSDTSTTPAWLRRDVASDTTSIASDDLPRYRPRVQRTYRFGLTGGAAYSFQEAEINFTGPSGRPSGGNCRCQFDQGQGLGFVAGLSLSLGFSNDLWGQTTRISYALHSAHTTFSDTTLVFRVGKPEPEQEVSTEEFDLKFTSLNAEILFSRSLGFGGLYVTVGPSMNYILSNSYAVTLSVAEVEYKPSAGKLENIEKLYTSVVGGIGARLPLGSSGTLVQPEILYSYPLDRISRRYQWNVHSIRAAVTLLVSL